MLHLLLKIGDATMLHKFTYIENNIIGLIISAVIFINIRHKRKRAKFDDKLFITLIISNSLIMILNIIINIMDGYIGLLFREVNVLLTTIYFMLNSIPYLTWALYVDYYIHKDIKRIKNIFPLVALPAFISIILSISSVFNGAIFFIDQNNIYNRGELFTLNSTIYYFYFIYSYVKIIVNRKSLRKKDYYSLFIFAIAPALAGIVQIYNFGRSYIWLSISMSTLIIFIDIQNNEISRDYLTGLYNRRQLDKYLKGAIREIRESESLLLIMMDINDFKDINDIYGHIEGDRALKKIAEILIESFRTDDFISRYAGDEFMAILKLEKGESAKPIIRRIRKNFNEFNERRITAYDLELSIGYDIYKPELKMSPDDFIKHVDSLMYQDKKCPKSITYNYKYKNRKRKCSYEVK